MSKIFLVDDDEDQIKLFTDALERYGFELTSYANLVTALKNFTAGIYDMAIIDVMLPKMNALELSQKLMDIDRLITILYLTAGDLHSNELNRDYPNLQWIIRKPVTIRKLIEEINSVLALGQNMPLLWLTVDIWDCKLQLHIEVLYDIGALKREAEEIEIKMKQIREHHHDMSS